MLSSAEQALLRDDLGKILRSAGDDVVIEDYAEYVDMSAGDLKKLTVVPH